MAGKRSNGEGSIYRRSDGRWGASAFVDTTSGKRKRIHIYGPTRQDVHDRLAEKLAEARRGIRTPDKEWTVGAYLDYWLVNVVTPKDRPRTVELYEGCIRLYLKPVLGHVSLAKLTIQRFQAFLNEQLAAGRSVRSVHRMRNTLRAALSRAEREELIVRNVAKLAELPPYESKPGEAWTVGEAARFLQAAQAHRLYAAFMMPLIYGMRRGEVLGLRWGDVDFARNKLRIRQQLQRIGGKLVQGPVKTAAGRRDLPLVALLREELARMFVQRFGKPVAMHSDQDAVCQELVFVSTAGTPVDPKNFANREFHRLCDQAGVRHIRFHDNRHTTATLLKNLGVPDRDIQLILGHAHVTTTQQLYQHADLEGQAKALAKAEQQLLAVGVAAKSAANNEFSTGESMILHALTPGGATGNRTQDTLLKRAVLTVVGNLPTPVTAQLRMCAYTHILGWVAVRMCCKSPGTTAPEDPRRDASGRWRCSCFGWPRPRLRAPSSLGSAPARRCRVLRTHPLSSSPCHSATTTRKEASPMTSAYLNLDSTDLHTDVSLRSAPATPSPPASEGPTVKRSVRLLRVSSKGQMDSDYDRDPEGNSIDTQRKVTMAKEQAMGTINVGEYVEPGYSGQSIVNRPFFQQLLKRIVEQRDVDYVVIYMRSRVFRNYIEAGIIKQQLSKLGVKLISAKEDFGEGIMAEAMEAVTDVFNWLQVRMSGEDIKVKMGNKARNGGTLGRAKLGYLNVRKRIDGHEVRTIAIDDDRAPFVRLAFELYATGEYTLEDLADELYDRGLRSRPTARHPATKVSINKLSQMLRDKYYVGWVSYQGEEIKGRHEPLIEEDLFERVQDIIESRANAKERHRVHHWYLRGSVFCGRCRRRGTTQRLLFQRAVNSKGYVYDYLFCRNKQHGRCDAPHVNILLVEEAVENHYATIRFSPRFIEDVRAHLAEVIGEQEAATRLLHRQITGELRRLDTEEDNLINLGAADLTASAKAKITTKLHDIEQQRRHLSERLDQTSQDLSDSARLIEACLKLLENPYELYRRCDDEQRRMLNQAIFHAIFIEEELVTDHELKEPFARLHAVQEGRRTVLGHRPDPPDIPAQPQDASRAVSSSGDGPTSWSGVEVLLAGIDLGQCSSKHPKVDMKTVKPAGWRAGAESSRYLARTSVGWAREAARPWAWVEARWARSRDLRP